MNVKTTFLTLLTILIIPAILLGELDPQEKTIMLMKSLENPALAPLDYVLGPGDQLQLDLWGNANATYQIAVAQDGYIFIPKSGQSAPEIAIGSYRAVPPSDVLPALGEIKAEGLTLNELREEIEKRVRKYYRGVHVRISLVGLRLIPVSIHGSVKEPGAYSITPLYRVSHLIEIAGGISLSGSYRNASIEGANGETKICDLYKFQYKGALSENPYLKAGDVVMIPQAIMSVRISGRVFRTGNYELKPGERIKDLIEMAGGYQKRGSLTRTIKIYNVKTPDDVIEVDPYKLLIEDDSLSNIELQTGDVITVPMEPFTVTIVGQVTQGGTFEFEPGADFNYYLGLAGGYSERANEGDIRITRWDGARLKWKKGVEMKPGDTIVVGRSELKGWRDYLEVTLNAANLLFIIWTVSTK